VLKYQFIPTKTVGEEAFWKCGQTSWHQDRHPDLKTDILTSWHQDRHPDIKTDILTSRQTSWHPDIKTDILTSRQTSWQTDTKLTIRVAKAERSWTNSKSDDSPHCQSRDCVQDWTRSLYLPHVHQCAAELLQPPSMSLSGDLSPAHTHTHTHWQTYTHRHTHWQTYTGINTQTSWAGRQLVCVLAGFQMVKVKRLLSVRTAYWTCTSINSSSIIYKLYLQLWMHGHCFTPSADTVTPLHHVFICILYIECTGFTPAVNFTGFTDLLQPERGLSANSFTAISCKLLYQQHTCCPFNAQIPSVIQLTAQRPSTWHGITIQSTLASTTSIHG